jgi:hypothetical protein
MRGHGLGIGHQAVRGSLDNHDQPVEGVPVTPTVNSASVIDLRAYADPSVVPTLALVDLQNVPTQFWGCSNIADASIEGN